MPHGYKRHWVGYGVEVYLKVEADKDTVTTFAPGEFPWAPSCFVVLAPSLELADRAVKALAGMSEKNMMIDLMKEV